jgi:hypothetical protein
VLLSSGWNRKDYLRLERLICWFHQGGLVSPTQVMRSMSFAAKVMPHLRPSELLRQISRDDENKVVIITGTGDIYCSELDMGRNLAQMTTDKWDHILKPMLRVLRS